jgi:hypothetical protein
MFDARVHTNVTIKKENFIRSLEVDKKKIIAFPTARIVQPLFHGHDYRSGNDENILFYKGIPVEKKVKNAWWFC